MRPGSQASFLLIMFFMLGQSSIFAGDSDPRNFAYSRSFLSPDGTQLIIVDYYASEAGPCPETAVHYSLPMEMNQHREIVAADRYEWSEDSQWFATQKWDANPATHSPVLKTRIVIYDRNGMEKESPGYGTSPTFLHAKEQFLYYCEFSDAGEVIPPMIVSYDMARKAKTVLHQFEGQFTFWPEQYDIYVTPPCAIQHGGIRGLIRLKSDLYETYVFALYRGKLSQMAKASAEDLQLFQ